MRLARIFVWLLLPIGLSTATLYYYRDSFIKRRSLESNLSTTSSSGTVFFDRWRSQNGYNLVQLDLPGFECQIYRMTGELVRSLPGRFCHIFQDGRLLFFGREQLFFFAPNGEPLWNLPYGVHHDLEINEQTGSIFFVSHDLHGPDDAERWDVIRGLDFSGKAIFEWALREFRQDFELQLKQKLTPKKIEIAGVEYTQLTHLNSVQELPPNPLASVNPAFSAGNILVNNYRPAILFIIDRKSKKILWQFQPTDPQDSWRIHQARLDEKGVLHFLINQRNDGSGRPTDYSEIMQLNPLTKLPIKTITTDPKQDFFTARMGSLQRLSQDHYLVTSSLAGTAFEIDVDGRILWQWKIPNLSNFRERPALYRVTRLNSSSVDRLLDTFKF